MTITDIRNLVEKYFGVDLTEKRRLYDFIKCRFLYFYLCRKHIPKATFDKIGKSIGFNHATVIHGVKEHQYIYKADSSFAKHCDIIEAQITGCNIHHINDYKEVIKGLLLLIDELEALAKPNWELQEQKEYKQAKEMIIMQ